MSNCAESTNLSSIESPNKAFHPLKIQPSSFTSFKTPPKENDDLADSNQKEQSIDKFCMSKLCESFVTKFTKNTNTIFDTVTLMKEFGVKQRRVYDLMNIMQGCGCVQKKSKRKYQWIGPQKSRFLQPNLNKGDSTSLRQITARIKLLISKEKGLVTFNKINDTLLKENQDKHINPASIRRRIYECCKVMRIVGFIDKVGKHYQWIFNSSQPRIQIPLPENKKKYIRKIKSNFPQKELISEIVKRFSNEGDFQNFLEKLRDEFEEKRKPCKEQQFIYQ